jgi:HEAT repeat protein
LNSWRIKVRESAKQLSDSSIEIRRQAVECMSGRKDPACIPDLVNAMKDSSWRVRKTAVDILFMDYATGDYIDGLVGLLHIEDNAGARNSAIEALIKLGRKATVFLIDAFKTPNRDARKFIIDVLGELKDNRSLGLMLEALRDEDENVRATAVEHLGKIGEVSAVDALIDILDNGDLWTAYPAADALGRIGNRKAVPHLLRALDRKPMREPVLKALGLLADPSALGKIIPLLEDGSKNVQEQTLKTIERLYHNGIDAGLITDTLKAELGEKAIQLILKHAWSNKKEVRIAAILLSGLMKDEAAYGPLLDISQEDEFSEDIKKALVYIGSWKPESLLKLFKTDSVHRLRFICDVAGKIGSPVYYDVLEAMLGNEDGHVRALAALSISRLGRQEAGNKLLTLLTDPYEDVQEAAVCALGNLVDYIDTGELLAMLRSENRYLRRNTAILLGKKKDEGAVSDLGFALKDEEVIVRKAVVVALSSIGTAEAVRHLTCSLTDEEPDIRITAILSLASAGGAGVLDSMLILAVDPDDFVRVSAAKALGILKDYRAVKTLTGMLSDRSGFVTTAAIESLKAFAGDEARDAILNMLSSDDEEIKRTAISALEVFEGVEDRLISFLKDPDWASRVAAVRVLGKSQRTSVRLELEKLLDTDEDPAVIKAVEEILGV